MENEVQNQAAPTPEAAPIQEAAPTPEGSPDKPACCSRKPLIVAAIAAILLIVVAAVVACLFIFDVFGTPLPKYAPAGTDLIVHINGKKLANTKIFKAFKGTAMYEEMVKDAKNSGIDLDKAILGELCLFQNARDSMNGKDNAPSLVYRGSQAGNIFKSLRNKAEKRVAAAKKDVEKYNIPATAVPEFSTDRIDGKPAYVFSRRFQNEAAILLADNLVQKTSAGTKDGLIVKPLKKGNPELARSIDTNAIVSAAWKVSIPKDLFEGKDDPAAKLAGSVADDLEIVTLKVSESGDDLNLALVGVYKSADKAKSAQESLVALRKLAQEMSQKTDPDVAGIIKAIEIAQNGNKVTLSLRCNEDKLVAMIEKADKEQRERRKRREEERKRYEERSKRLEEERKAVEKK